MKSEKRIAESILAGLKEAIEMAQSEYDKLNKQIEAMPDEPKPWPQDGDECFVIWAGGLIGNRSYGKCYTKELKQGNIKRTGKEAKALVAYRAAYTKLANMVPSDFVIDWEDDMQYKYFLYYNNNTKRWEYAVNHIQQFSQLPYFPTRESLQAALEAMGDDMDALKFGGCM